MCKENKAPKKATHAVVNAKDDIEAVSAEALRKLGRNIINFAKIEAGFKHLLAVSQLRGTPETMRDQLLKNQAKLSKQTLGTLVRQFNQTVVDDVNYADPTADYDGSGIVFALKFVYNTPEIVRKQRDKLSAIVAERNKLIHHDLAHIDTSSVEDYCNLIILLDEQQPRLLAQLDELKWIIKCYGKGIDALATLIPSTDLPQEVPSDQADIEQGDKSI